MVNHPHRAIAWESHSIYEHPAEHQHGQYGIVMRHASGVYTLRQGGGYMSCPQGWAARIEKLERDAILALGVEIEEKRRKP